MLLKIKKPHPQNNSGVRNNPHGSTHVAPNIWRRSVAFNGSRPARLARFLPFSACAPGWSSCVLQPGALITQLLPWRSSLIPKPDYRRVLAVIA